ncbi:hypothetical protein DSO57_1018910 [Entomophthora muscae]|uniref:Uncharacterized protein n=2 Tax=Entomophthora muscae TaxID=34485 RepID=A0ACC2TRC6_9FUNG|nr:hypothetical protein DSO57_1035761 [Entomophthora muscae]KAJ9077218.1 hypothetical protein DSO57_1018910 [Entomophthora muscae]
MDDKIEKKVNPELLESRARLLEVKKQIEGLLKEDFTDYWSRLEEFLVGKLSQDQLGFFTRSFLTGNSALLHNELVKLALKCAILPVDAPKFKPPVVPEADKTLSKKRQFSSQEDMLFHEHVKKFIKLRSKKEINQLKALPQRVNVKVELPYSIPVSLPPLTGDAAAFYGRGIQLPLCSESKLLPNLEMMRIKANTIALENNLTEGADSKVAEVILQGLETHLESLLTNCLFKIRLKQTRSALSGSSDSHLTKQNTISTRDLQTTFTISPHLLAERPNAMERLVVIHNPAFPPAILHPTQTPQQKAARMFASRNI